MSIRAARSHAPRTPIAERTGFRGFPKARRARRWASASGPGGRMPALLSRVCVRRNRNQRRMYRSAQRIRYAAFSSFGSVRRLGWRSRLRQRRSATFMPDRLRLRVGRGLWVRGECRVQRQGPVLPIHGRIDDCPVDIGGCACDGTSVIATCLGAAGLPQGYAPRPLVHAGLCSTTDGGYHEAGGSDAAGGPVMLAPTASLAQPAAISQARCAARKGNASRQKKASRVAGDLSTQRARAMGRTSVGPLAIRFCRRATRRRPSHTKGLALTRAPRWTRAPRRARATPIVRIATHPAPSTPAPTPIPRPA